MAPHSACAERPAAKSIQTTLRHLRMKIPRNPMNECSQMEDQYLSNRTMEATPNLRKKIAEIFALFMECIRAWIASFDCIGREIIGQMYFQEFRGRRDIDLIVLTLFSSHLLAKELNQLVQWVAFSQDRILRIRLLWRFFLMTQQLGHSPNINFKGWREAETVLSPVAWNFSLKSCLS